MEDKNILIPDKHITIGILARGLTKGGVTRYIRNILSEFEKVNNKNISFFLFTDDKNFIGAFKNIKVIFVKNRNKPYWDYFRIIPSLLKVKPDIIFYPKNIIPFTHGLLRAKKINIIHDLAHFEKNMKAYPFLVILYMKIFMKLSCQIADKIIAISKYTKQDIINRLGINSEKIAAVYEGVEDKFRVIHNSEKLNSTLKKYELTKPFLFYSGSISPRKNLLRMLKSFYKIKDQIPHNLVVVGAKTWGSDKVYKYISENLKNRVKILGYVSDEELVDLYNMADMYLYPSLYEGFGLPILEAQACGCPVLTSNVTSCPEVAGDSAMIVNPYSTDEIAEAILKIFTDKNLREDLIKRGHENIKRFSWKKTAERILNICDELTENV